MSLSVFDYSFGYSHHLSLSLSLCRCGRMRRTSRKLLQATARLLLIDLRGELRALVALLEVAPVAVTFLTCGSHLVLASLCLLSLSLSLYSRSLHLTPQDHAEAQFSLLAGIFAVKPLLDDADLV